MPRPQHQTRSNRTVPDDHAAGDRPYVSGWCPACQKPSLWLAPGGRVECFNRHCPEPTQADDLLHGTWSSPTYEVVAEVNVVGSNQALAFNLNDDHQAVWFVRELRDLIVGYLAPDEYDGPDEDPPVTVDVRKKPPGHVASLREHGGW